MDKNNNKPKLRFPGFTDPWEQRKLNEIADVLDGDRGKNYPNGEELQERGHTLFLSASNVTTDGFMFGDNQYITEEKSNSMGNGKLVLDDIVLTSRGSIGHIAWYNKAVQQQVPFARINSGMLILRSKDFVMPCFVVQFLKSPLGKKQIDLISFGSAQPQLTKKDVSNYVVSIPSDSTEQRKLGNFFTNLDNLITLHQRKLNHLQDKKKSLLQKMFPKNGEDFPELRFSGFTDPWEQRKLGEILTLLKDGTHGTHLDVDNGLLLLSAKNIKNGIVCWDNNDRRISESDYQKIHSNFTLQKGDILLTIVGSIGETAILQDCCGITFQRSVAFLRPKDDLMSEFLYSEIQSPKFQKELLNRKSTSAQPGIYLGDLSVVPILYPKNLEEQKLISSFMINLDNLITLHQRKLKHLQEQKKALLQQMFV